MGFRLLTGGGVNFGLPGGALISSDTQAALDQISGMPAVVGIQGKDSYALNVKPTVFEIGTDDHGAQSLRTHNRSLATGVALAKLLEEGRGAVQTRDQLRAFRQLLESTQRNLEELIDATKTLSLAAGEKIRQAKDLVPLRKNLDALAALRIQIQNEKEAVSAILASRQLGAESKSAGIMADLDSGLNKALVELNKALSPLGRAAKFVGGNLPEYLASVTRFVQKAEGFLNLKNDLQATELVPYQGSPKLSIAASEESGQTTDEKFVVELEHKLGAIKEALVGVAQHFDSEQDKIMSYGHHDDTLEIELSIDNMRDFMIQLGAVLEAGSVAKEELKSLSEEVENVKISVISKRQGLSDALTYLLQLRTQLKEMYGGSDETSAAIQQQIQLAQEAVAELRSELEYEVNQLKKLESLFEEKKQKFIETLNASLQEVSQFKDETVEALVGAMEFLPSLATVVESLKSGCHDLEVTLSQAIKALEKSDTKIDHNEDELAVIPVLEAPATSSDTNRDGNNDSDDSAVADFVKGEKAGDKQVAAMPGAGAEGAPLTEVQNQYLRALENKLMTLATTNRNEIPKMFQDDCVRTAMTVLKRILKVFEDTPGDVDAFLSHQSDMWGTALKILQDIASNSSKHVGRIIRQEWKKIGRELHRGSGVEQEKKTPNTIDTTEVLNRAKELFGLNDADFKRLKEVLYKTEIAIMNERKNGVYASEDTNDPWKCISEEKHGIISVSPGVGILNYICDLIAGNEDTDTQRFMKFVLLAHISNANKFKGFLGLFLEVFDKTATLDNVLDILQREEEVIKKIGSEVQDIDLLTLISRSMSVDVRKRFGGIAELEALLKLAPFFKTVYQIPEAAPRRRADFLAVASTGEQSLFEVKSYSISSGLDSRDIIVELEERVRSASQQLGETLADTPNVESTKIKKEATKHVVIILPNGSKERMQVALSRYGGEGYLTYLESRYNVSKVHLGGIEIRSQKTKTPDGASLDSIQEQVVARVAEQIRGGIVDTVSNLTVDDPSGGVEEFSGNEITNPDWQAVKAESLTDQYEALYREFIAIMEVVALLRRYDPNSNSKNYFRVLPEAREYAKKESPSQSDLDTVSGLIDKLKKSIENQLALPEVSDQIIVLIQNISSNPVLQHVLSETVANSEASDQGDEDQIISYLKDLQFGLLSDIGIDKINDLKAELDDLFPQFISIEIEKMSTIKDFENETIQIMILHTVCLFLTCVEKIREAKEDGRRLTGDAYDEFQERLKSVAKADKLNSAGDILTRLDKWLAAQRRETTKSNGIRNQLLEKLRVYFDLGLGVLEFQANKIAQSKLKPKYARVIRELFHYDKNSSEAQEVNAALDFFISGNVVAPRRINALLDALEAFMEAGAVFK